MDYGVRLFLLNWLKECSTILLSKCVTSAIFSLMGQRYAVKEE